MIDPTQSQHDTDYNNQNQAGSTLPANTIENEHTSLDQDDELSENETTTTDRNSAEGMDDENSFTDDDEEISSMEEDEDSLSTDGDDIPGEDADMLSDDEAVSTDEDEDELQDDEDSLTDDDDESADETDASQRTNGIL